MSNTDNDVRNKVVAWARANARIRRVWILGREQDGPDGNVNIAIELEPVADSEETAALWMAHSDKWQSELQEKSGSAVSLEWLDQDGSTPGVRKAVAAGADLIYVRAG